MRSTGKGIGGIRLHGDGWLGHSEAVPQEGEHLGHRFAMPQPPVDERP